MNRILIAEDESRIVSFLEKGLKSNGFTTTVAKDAEEAIGLVLSNRFDLLLLDLGLPKKDGLEVLEQLRGQGATLPIIILTARDDINDKVSGLEGGADDYVTKPFRFEELLARIRLRMRKSQAASHNGKITTQLQINNLTLDLHTRKVIFNGQEIELPAKEFCLLETFMSHPEQVMTREQLLDRVWGFDYDPGSNIVDVYIGYLRKKLGSKVIKTVRGVGYCLSQM
ncbi:response regulator with CheY-like receiver domain and winged-helix DNA-binding domain [Xenococcus sp. PCC 7305]|uniref:response regulator transcription factor n=1 Tax=Xenococcus sp. PCC 7305 TaxID=102125 RepID=UPI0002AC5B68|nr:response regulator transcription factor [Xenococcus sp. PCC 7305]ELS03721.1 response regulator with CheY-like receiver domain and winged-helix DNA-binding domain [Xenococcus sp. PCC 7305]